MKEIKKSELKHETSSLPIARFDSMDENFVLPLREYLHSHGCQVFVNNGPTENVTYYVLVGDSGFVKRTLAFRHDFGNKRLILCWDTEDHETIREHVAKDTKLAFIDPKPLQEDMVLLLFSFFFTSRKKEEDFQTAYFQKSRIASRIKSEFQAGFTPTRNVAPEYTQEIKLSEKDECGDSSRVKKAILDVYHSTLAKGEHQKKYTSVHPTVALSITLLLLLMLPFFLFPFSLLSKLYSIKRGVSCISSSKKSCKNNQAYTYSSSQLLYEASCPIVYSTLLAFGKNDVVLSFERFSVLLTYAERLITDFSNTSSSLTDLVSILFPTGEKSETSPVVAVDTVRKTLPSIRQNLDLSFTAIDYLKKHGTFPFTLPFVNKTLNDLSTKLVSLRQISEVGERIGVLYPLVGGFRGKHTMLVLLQNSSELRPTGGFIGSVMILTLTDGNIVDMKIEDVYTLDGQLKGHVEPPEPIRLLLNQIHWYLRDSNWNPNFQNTGEVVRWFYEKETGDTVDSVVGITSSLLVKLLASTGPIDLPSYNDTITKDNFYSKSLTYTHKDFFPGSTQKKDFLALLFEEIVKKLEKNKGGSQILLLSTISSALSSRDIQWYATSPETEHLLSQYGWAGITPKGTVCIGNTNGSPCLFSYLLVNESNMGVNKVSSFIERIQTRTLTIGENDVVSESITRRIRNLSNNESGTGTYSAYLRFFLPKDTTVTSLTLDNKQVLMKSPGKKPTALPWGESDTSIDALTGTAVAFDVPAGRERVVSISYTHTPTLMFSDKSSFMTVFEEKQAGVDTVNETIQIRYPKNWRIIPEKGSSSVVANNGRFEYNTSLSEDSEHTFRIIK